MKFRKGNLSDWKEILQILNNTNELQGNDEGGTYSEDWIKGSLIDKKRNYVLICEENKRIIGFLMAEIFIEKRYSFFVDLFINERYRKIGLATKLIKEYEKYCIKKDLRSIIGLILNKNLKMHNLMKKQQYKKGNLFYYYEKRLR